MPNFQRAFLFVVAGSFAIYVCCGTPVAAQAHPGAEPPPRVVSLRVVTESGAVLQQNPTNLTLQAGQPFSMEAESATLRELFKTGRYADLRAELVDVPGGVRLDYVVRQNYFINRVRVEGLREPPGEPLALSALRLNLGETFRESDIKEAIQRLRQTLEDEGQYQADIQYALIPHADTLQMDIVVHVVPGTRASIGAITIQNQTAYSGEELREHFKVKEGSTATSGRLRRASDRARKWLAGKEYLGARVTLHRGAYEQKANTVPLDVTFYAGLEVHVIVEGAKVPQGTLRKLLPIYEEGAVDEDLLQEGRRALREWFQRAGYFDAAVSFTTTESAPSKSGNITAPAARVITYEVRRGDRHRLVGVAFAGNRYFGTELLTSRLKTQPAAYASPGRYSTTLLEDDVASIRTLYDANGFHETEVHSQLLNDYQSHHGDLFVRFDIKEGPQTRVATLTVEGNQHLSTEEVLGIVGSTQGQPYSDFNVSSDRDNILAMYFDRGFPEARFSAGVDPVPSVTPGGNPQVQLAYHIAEGKQILVARVLLSGYEHTRAGVISRAVDVRAGQPLSEGAVVDTQRKLYNLGIFSRVSVAPQNPEGDDPEKTVIVMVDEAKRYTVAYGLGFEAQRLGSGGGPVNGSFTVSPRAILEATKANFSGRADTLSFKARASTIQGRALLAYADPSLFASPDFSLQVSAFFDKTRNVQTFTSKRYEATLQIAQKISLIHSLIYHYSYRHVTATNLNISPQEIPLFNQPTQISEFGVSWFRDKRNNPADATRGDFENVNISVALKPIGSSANFSRVFLQNSTYHPLGKRLVFARTFRLGVQTPFGGSVSNDIPLPERFFAGGGTTLRGFGLNQAGPRDAVTGFPIGGQALLVFNQDLRFPMHLPFIGNRLGGAVFYDAGNVFTSFRKITLRPHPPVAAFDSHAPGVCLTNCTNELNYFSHTVGFELRYGTPIGPVAVDLAYQINPASFLAPLKQPNGSTVMGVSRLPHFQFFVNLGTTF